MADFDLLGDGLRKVLLAGIGALATGYEKSSELVDELVKKAGNLSDYDEQTKAVNAAEKEAFKLYGTIPVSNPASYLGAKKGLANYGPSGFAGNLPQDIGWQK